LVEITRLQSDVSADKATLAAMRALSAGERGPPVVHPSPTTPPPLGSVIVSNFLAIFAEFRGRRFSLLWRAILDDFKGKAFHRQCDVDASTLTVILDTDGNIFGDFTPAAWESRHCRHWKVGDSRQIFIFTLKNSHTVAASRVALKAKQSARMSPELFSPRISFLIKCKLFTPAKFTLDFWPIF
jgi:hypothetical protein